MDKNIRADRVEKAIARAEKGKGYPGLVTDFYRNKQLFDAYPQLTTLRLEFAKLNDDVVGEYDKKHDIIRLNTNEEYRDEIRSTIIHEIQHSIQDIEGFASGGSPNKFTSKSVQSLKDELQQLKDKIKGLTEKSERSQIQKRIKRVKAAIDFANDAQTDSIIETDNYFYTDADEAYENLGGEVEARNAENRIDLTAKERREQT